MRVLVFGGFDLEKSRLYVVSSYLEVLLSLNAKVIIFPLSELAKGMIEEYINECECVLFVEVRIYIRGFIKKSQKEE